MVFGWRNGSTLGAPCRAAPMSRRPGRLLLLLPLLLLLLHYYTTASRRVAGECSHSAAYLHHRSVPEKRTVMASVRGVPLAADIASPLPCHRTSMRQPACRKDLLHRRSNCCCHESLGWPRLCSNTCPLRHRHLCRATCCQTPVQRHCIQSGREPEDFQQLNLSLLEARLLLLLLLLLPFSVALFPSKRFALRWSTLEPSSLALADLVSV